GIPRRDEQEASMWTWQSPFMSACDPLIQAERRFKARCLNRSRWDCSLAAGRWCPVARCRKYLRPATALSNRGFPQDGEVLVRVRVTSVNRAGQNRMTESHNSSRLRARFEPNCPEGIFAKLTKTTAIRNLRLASPMPQ